MTAEDARPDLVALADRVWQAAGTLNTVAIPEKGQSDKFNDAVTALIKVANELRAARLPSAPEPGEPRLLARWPEADLFAALDAEGWFRGLDTADATRYAKALYARLCSALATSHAAESDHNDNAGSPAALNHLPATGGPKRDGDASGGTGLRDVPPASQPHAAESGEP